MFPVFNFGPMQTNLAATPSVTVPGTTITSNGSANTKGSYTTLIASTNYDVWAISVMVNNVAQSALAINVLLDIAIGGAGSEVDIVPNLLVGGAAAINTAMAPILRLPIFIPKGKRISARCQDAVGGDTANVVIMLHGGPSIPPWKSYSGCVNLGADTATSGGLAHTAGNSGTESSWTSIGSPTSRKLFAIMPMIQNTNLTSINSLAYHLEFGFNSTTLAEYLIAASTAEFFTGPFPAEPHPCIIPASTQLQIRAECSGTAQQLQYALLGFY